MKKTHLIILAVVLIGLIAVLFLVNRDKDAGNPDEVTLEVLGDPMDATTEFYRAWHEAELSTTTDPQTENLINHPRLSEEVRTSLTESLNDEGTEVNPVLCQTVVPPRFGTKLSYILDNEAEVHVLARGLDERSSRTAVVKLNGVNGEWVISSISCAHGESGPEREFTFEKEGFLLKSVPPPLNPDYWHLVFKENGVDGHTAPLFFNASSTCVMTDGTEQVCDPSTFSEPAKALTQGEMSEIGVDVKRITFLP